MIKITINLATKKYVGRGLGIALPTAVIVLSVMLSLYLNGMAKGYVDTVERMGKKAAELSRTMPGKPDMQMEADLTKANLAAVSDIVQQRGFSWIGALDNLERAFPPNVTLISIQPSFKEGGAKLSGYAKDFASLSRFIDNLERLRVYKRVYLIGHSRKDIDEGKEAILFNLSIEGEK